LRGAGIEIEPEIGSGGEIIVGVEYADANGVGLAIA
jgi:hypothetical protein